MKKMHIGINGIAVKAKTEQNLVLFFRNKRHDSVRIKMRNPSKKQIESFAKALQALSKKF